MPSWKPWCSLSKNYVWNNRKCKDANHGSRDETTTRQNRSFQALWNEPATADYKANLRTTKKEQFQPETIRKNIHPNTCLQPWYFKIIFKRGWGWTQNNSSGHRHLRHLNGDIITTWRLWTIRIFTRKQSWNIKNIFLHRWP